MEKIKCPFCGEEINASSKFCPNCGRELENIDEEEQEEYYFPHASSTDSSWVNKWKTRDLVYKLVYTAIFVILIVTHFVFVNKYNGIKNATGLDIIDEKVNSGIIMYLSGFGSIFSGMIFLHVILRFRVTVATVGGYTVAVASGIYDRLIVEGEVQVKKENTIGGIFSRRYAKDMEGTLPNNKKVWANIVSFFGTAAIGEGEPQNNH